MFNERLEDLEDRLGPERTIAKAVRALELAAERERQSGPGGLMHFIRYFWHLVEPSETFVDGWVLHAMAAHLEDEITDWLESRHVSHLPL